MKKADEIRRLRAELVRILERKADARRDPSLTEYTRGVKMDMIKQEEDTVKAKIKKFRNMIEKEKKYEVPESWLTGLKQIALSLEKSMDDKAQTTMNYPILIGYLRSIDTILKYNEIKND